MTTPPATAGPSTTTTAPMVRAEGVSKLYRSGGRELTALTGLDLEVRREEFLSLLGPSGCGKSTALNIMGGRRAATSGSVQLDGAPVDGPSRDVGMMFQKAVMFPWRTTLENVLLPVQVFGRDKKQHLGRARELLDLVGISEFADSYPWQLSGGMQQRAALCRVLIHDPQLLLLDEPFGALDEFTRESMNMELLRLQARTRKTTVLVTHNIAEAVFMSDRIAVMTARPGRLVGMLEIPFERPREPELMSTTAFTDLVFEARRMLGLP